MEKCTECENWQRRGDELFDQLETLRNSERSDSEELEGLKESYDKKCDEFRRAMLLNANLRLLLHAKGIDHDL